jgi:glyoxylase-like metal-dependent hydrolase (beta-lactamase superfamily II)
MSNEIGDHEMHMLQRRNVLIGGLTMAGAFAAGAVRAGERAPSLNATLTEEGQSVVHDAYTWRRRELDKKLPLRETWPSEALVAAQFKRFGLDQAPIPEAIPTPAQILRDVYLVNSVPNHTYLIDGGAQGLALVDPGLLSNAEAILKNVEALGFQRRAIRWVINTHAHYDHSEADAHFQGLGAEILIGRGDASAVERATNVTAKYVLPSAQRTNYPVLSKPARALDDGEEIQVGNKTIVAISTPGHTPGSTCYRLEIDGRNILFGGDTILFDYRLGAQRTPFIDNAAYLASLMKLALYFSYLLIGSQWDLLLPGHGTIVLDRAYLDVSKAVRQVQWAVTTGEPINALPFADRYYRELMFGRP